MLDYLQGNLQTLDQFLKEKMPKVRAVLPEASYLAWLDFSDYGLTHEQLKDKLLNEAKVALNDGITFGGKNYECCFRLNLGCPKQQLLDALDRIEKALKC
jgi:cystathionine beta-lyase